MLAVSYCRSIISDTSHARSIQWQRQLKPSQENYLHELKTNSSEKSITHFKIEKSPMHASSKFSKHSKITDSNNMLQHHRELGRATAKNATIKAHYS